MKSLLRLVDSFILTGAKRVVDIYCSVTGRNNFSFTRGALVVGLAAHMGAIVVQDRLWHWTTFATVPAGLFTRAMVIMELRREETATGDAIQRGFWTSLAWQLRAVYVMSACLSLASLPDAVAVYSLKHTNRGGRSFLGRLLDRTRQAVAGWGLRPVPVPG